MASLKAHRLLWQPGQTGKGVLMDDGSVWTWPTENMRPRHMDMSMKFKAQGLQARPGTAFHIEPEGRVWQYGEGRSLSPDDVFDIQKANAGLWFGDPKPPGEVDAPYGHAESLMGPTTFSSLKTAQMAPGEELMQFLRDPNAGGSFTGHPNNPMGQNMTPSANPANPSTNPDLPGSYKNPSNLNMNPNVPGSLTNPSNLEFNPELPGSIMNPTTPQRNPAYPGSMTNPSNPMANPAYPGSYTNPSNPMNNPAFPTPSDAPRPEGVSENASTPPNHLGAWINDESSVWQPGTWGRGLEDEIESTGRVLRQRLGLAADPNWWQTQTEPLWHGTTIDNLPSIMQHGLLPWDHPSHASGSPWTSEDPMYEPRPGHVYLTQRPAHAQQAVENVGYNHPPVLLRVDPTKLDPQNINPDEDVIEMYPSAKYDEPDMPTGFGDIRDQMMQEDEVMRRIRENSTWGQRAEQLHWGDDPKHTQWGVETMGNVAHRGPIPPHALTPYIQDKHLQWTPLPKHYWGATSIDDLEPLYASHREGVQKINNPGVQKINNPQTPANWNWIREADNWQSDTRNWPDPTEPRAGKPPMEPGCTCPEGKKLDCPIHGLWAHAEDLEDDKLWNLPEGSPVSYPQDAPRSWQQALGSAAPPPPNYRKADSPKRCGTCKMFDKGLCWGYGNTRVEEDAVCDSFAPEGGEHIAANGVYTDFPDLDAELTDPIAPTTMYHFHSPGLEEHIREHGIQPTQALGFMNTLGNGVYGYDYDPHHMHQPSAGDLYQLDMRGLENQMRPDYEIEGSWFYPHTVKPHRVKRIAQTTNGAVCDSFAPEGKLLTSKVSANAIPLDQIAYIAEGALERGGLVGRKWHVPQNEVKQYREGPPPRLHPIEQQMTTFAQQVTGLEHARVFASNWIGSGIGDTTSGSADPITGYITVRFDTNDLVILHECAHLMAGSNSRGHTPQWFQIAHDLYTRYLGAEAGQNFWNLVSPYLEPETKVSANDSPQVVYHDDIEPNPIGGAPEGYWGRWPVIYDEKSDTLHIGPEGTTHGQVADKVGGGSIGRGLSTRYEGWRGHNPKDEVEAGLNSEVHHVGGQEYGWYNGSPGPAVNWAMATFNYPSHPDSDQREEGGYGHAYRFTGYYDKDYACPNCGGSIDPQHITRVA